MHKNNALGRKNVAIFFLGGVRLSKIGWAFEKESIPQVSSRLDSFFASYHESNLELFGGNVSQI